MEPKRYQKEKGPGRELTPKKEPRQDKKPKEIQKEPKRMRKKNGQICTKPTRKRNGTQHPGRVLVFQHLWGFRLLERLGKTL